MTTITTLNHITLAVRDLNASLHFYTQALGCRPVATWPAGAYLLAGKVWLALVVDAAARAAATGIHAHRIQRCARRFPRAV